MSLRITVLIGVGCATTWLAAATTVGAETPDPPDPPPTAPFELRVAPYTDFGAGLWLYWEHDGDFVDSFQVEQSTQGPEGPWFVLADLSDDRREYNDANYAEATTTYWYRVGALSGADEVAYSDALFIDSRAPAEFRTTVVADGGIGVWLEWRDVLANEQGYVVERSPTGAVGSFGELVTLPPGSGAYADFDVVAGTTYWYRVAALLPGSERAYTEVVSETAGGSFFPDPVTAEPTIVLPPTGSANQDATFAVGWVSMLALFLSSLGAASLLCGLGLRQARLK